MKEAEHPPRSSDERPPACFAAASVSPSLCTTAASLFFRRFDVIFTLVLLAARLREIREALCLASLHLRVLKGSPNLAKLFRAWL